VVIDCDRYSNAYCSGDALMSMLEIFLILVVIVLAVLVLF